MKKLIRTIVATAAVLVSVTSVHAQAWPNKPIRLVVAYGAGSPPDSIARIYAEPLSKELGQVVVIDNKPGASGNLASAEVARAQGDGYTFLYNVASAFTINPFVYNHMGFDPAKDLEPVATTMIQGYAVVANTNFKVNTFADLLKEAKANPDKYSYGSWGVGSFSHVFMELVLGKSNGKMLHVPYRTAPLNEILGGQVDVLVEPMASASQFIAAGRVKVLAYTGDKRHPSMPNVPTVTETLAGDTLYSWHGVWAPASTPKAIQNRLNAAMNKVAKDPAVIAKIKGLNVDQLTATPDEMKKMITKESAVFGPLLKQLNIKLD